MVAPVAQDKKATPEALAEFVHTWRKQSQSLNFSQRWLDTETGEVVDFGAISDETALKKASDRAEAQYLAMIDTARREYVGRFPERQQRQAVIQFERELCKRDLYYLGKYVLAYEDAVFHLHYYMCKSMEDLPEGYRGLREFPRDAFKTTFLGISFIIQQILLDPDIRILYKSNAAPNAANKISEAKAHFIQSGSRIRELFPEHVPKTKAQEGSGSYWNSPAKTAVQREGTFSSAGVGGSKVSQHYNLILGDDFWDEKSVQSQETMGKCRKEMAQLEYLLATPAKGKIVYIGTRFAHDDPTTDLLENPVFHCVIVSGITPAGRSLFPENMTLMHLFAQANGSAYNFSCQIMLFPTDSSRGFLRSWFSYTAWSEIREAEIRGEIRTRKVILCDAAATGDSSSDYIAIHVVAIDNTGRRTVIEYVRDKLQPSEFVDELFRLWDKWKPDFIARQKTLLETTLMSFIGERNRKRDADQGRLRFFDYSLRKREKKGRITASLQPLLQGGLLHFDPGLPHLQELEKELLEHPKSQNDDGIDALAMLDDPLVSRIPTFLPPVPEIPENYSPSEAVPSTAEQIYRRQSAASAFARRRAPRRHGMGSLRP
jgi:predicted phage terminase large subunit-like protein